MLKSTESYRLANMAETADTRCTLFRAVIDIVDPDIVYGMVVSSGAAPWSKPEQLHDKGMTLDSSYATLERNRWLLNGGFRLMLNDPAQLTGQIGHVGDVLSGTDGSFPGETYVGQKLENVDVLQACTIYFPADSFDGFPVDFTVEVLQDGTAYFSKTFTGNTARSVAMEGFTVYNPDLIRVTCTRWSLPGRYLRVAEIIPGVYEEWDLRAVASLGIVQQGDVSCMTLPYGTCALTIDNTTKRFEPRKKQSLFKSLEERQGIRMEIGIRLADGTVEWKPVGVYCQKGDGWKTSDNGATLRWDLVDIIGLVCGRTFIPPETLPTTLGGWIAAIVAHLGDNFKKHFHVDPDYAEFPLTVDSVEDVTGKTCGDLLRWLCQASGTWPRAAAETGYLTVEPLWNEGNKVTLMNILNYPTMKANEDLAALIFTLHDGNNTQVVVPGNRSSASKSPKVDNPFIHTSDQALAAARLILSCYGGNQLEITGRGDPSSEIGDVDTVWLDESSATTGRRIYQTFNITNGVLQNCQGKLLQADGSYLFTEYAIITKSGKWKAPANVKDNILRVVIGQAGQGGSRGQDGYVGGSGVLPGQGVTAGYGERGLNGTGGKVWYGVVNINPEQEFEVHLGAGGAASDKYGVPGEMGEETTFGVYSSADGQVYANGYTDIANGNSFARTGVAAPVDGTGDGGAGGEGGEAGQGYWQQLYWTQSDVDSGKHPGASLNGRPVASGTPGSTSIVGASRGYRFVVTKEPGPGKPGVAGATGFVMVTWDKAEA